MEVKIGKEQIMISDFDDLEVFKIAMKIEHDGEKFYKSVISITEDPRVKRTFQRLAEDEKRHFEIFKALYDTELRARKIDPASVDMEEDIFTYIDSGIFSKNTTASSLKDAVLSGEEVELRSMLLYKQMLSQTKNEGGKKALKDILEEENMHLNILKSWEAAV